MNCTGSPAGPCIRMVKWILCIAPYNVGNITASCKMLQVDRIGSLGMWYRKVWLSECFGDCHWSTADPECSAMDCSFYSSCLVACKTSHGHVTNGDVKVYKLRQYRDRRTFFRLKSVPSHSWQSLPWRLGPQSHSAAWRGGWWEGWDRWGVSAPCCWSSRWSAAWFPWRSPADWSPPASEGVIRYSQQILCICFGIFHAYITTVCETIKRKHFALRDEGWVIRRWAEEALTRHIRHAGRRSNESFFTAPIHEPATVRRRWIVCWRRGI